MKVSVDKPKLLLCFKTIWDDQHRLSVITTPKNFRDVTEGMGYLLTKKFRMGLWFSCVMRMFFVFVAIRCKELVEVHKQIMLIELFFSAVDDQSLRLHTYIPLTTCVGFMYASENAQF